MKYLKVNSYITNIEMSIQTEIEEMYRKRYERNEIKKPAAGHTIYQHKNNITKIHQAITGKAPTLFGEMTWMDEKSPEEIFQVIKGLKGRKDETIGVATQRSYLSSVLVACRCIDFANGQDTPMWSGIYKLMNENMGEVIEHRIKLKEETKELMPDFDKLMEDTNKYLKEPLGDKEMKILLSIYTQFPVRLEIADLVLIKGIYDYNKLKKSTDKMTGNYLVISSRNNTSFLSMSNYKTADKYGTRILKIEDRYLLSLIRELAQERSTMTRLFPGLSRNNLSKKITEFYNKLGYKKISPTLLAKMIDTRAYESIPEEWRDKMKNLAEFRAHSLDTQAKFYIHN